MERRLKCRYGKSVQMFFQVELLYGYYINVDSCMCVCMYTVLQLSLTFILPRIFTIGFPLVLLCIHLTFHVHLNSACFHRAEQIPLFSSPSFHFHWHNQLCFGFYTVRWRILPTMGLSICWSSSIPFPIGILVIFGDKLSCTLPTC